MTTKKKNQVFQNYDARSRHNQHGFNQSNQTLRFNLGDNVLCRCKDSCDGITFKEGVIVNVNPRHNVAYVVELHYNNEKISCPEDSSEYIRLSIATDKSAEVLKQANPVLLAVQLHGNMFQAASHGTFEDISDLMGRFYGQFDVTCVDCKGHNILHLALISKRNNFLLQLHAQSSDPRYQYDKLIRAVDFDGRNSLHLSVLLGDIDIVNTCIFSGWLMTGRKLMSYPAYVQCDSKGRTPLDYAILFNKETFQIILGDNTFHTKYCMFKKEHTTDVAKSDIETLQLLIKHFTVMGMSLDRVHISNEVQQELVEMFNTFLMLNHVQCVKWLVECEGWSVFRRIFNMPDRLVRCFQVCTNSGCPSLTFAGPFGSANRVNLESDLRCELELLCERHWDCKSQSFEDFLLSRRVPDSLDSATSRYRFALPPVSVPQLVNRADKRGDELFQGYVGYHLFKIRSVPHFEVFEYLLNKADEHMLVFTQPFMVSVIRSGAHLAMLQYFVDRYWINLQEPLEHNEVYWKSAKAQYFMLDSNVPQRGLTLCEFLCVLSLMQEDVPIFEWLLDQCPNVKKLTVHSLNLVQTALLHNKCHILRFCLLSGRFGVNDLCFGGLDVLQGVVSASGHSRIVMMVLNFTGNICHPKSNFTMSHFARQSLLPEVKTWVNERSWDTNVTDMVGLLKTERIGSKGLIVVLDLYLYDMMTFPARQFDHVTGLANIVCCAVACGHSTVCYWLHDVLSRGVLSFTVQESVAVVQLIFRKCAEKSVAVPALVNIVFNGLLNVLVGVDCVLHPVVLIQRWFRLRRTVFFGFVVLIQSCFRRHRVQSRYKHYLGANHANWLRFRGVWGPVVRELSCTAVRSARRDWAAAQRAHAMVVTDHLLSEQFSIVEDITAVAAKAVELPRVPVTVPRPASLSFDATVESSSTTVGESLVLPSLENIDLSHSAVKWFESADPSLRTLFLKRIAQLADGQRSYALSKRLQGCECPIYETKLDKGMRILWTRLDRAAAGSVLVWFVSKHDDVCHFRDLIERSHQRQASPLVVRESIGACSALQLGDDDVLLDPTGNCPLKAYATSRTEITANHESMVRNWKPMLRLGGRQQQVNEESGTVLLLGRSGTGKTLCLCDRMIADKKRSAVPIRQLFVCRNKRLCEFVRYYQQQHSDAASIVNMHFMTLASFTSQMNISVKMDHGPSKLTFVAANKVDAKRFMALISDIRGKCSVDSGVVWLQIRSFIKGSVEAVIQKAPLTLEQYTDLSVFGADRCRLSVADRKEVYALYLRYEDVLKTQGLWDDADYTLDLLTRSKLEPLSTQYDMVYVDEVQDNTQAEIVLYFLAAGMNTQSLFLAGDPAQSVVEGVDFRFEDVRSIVHKLSDGRHSIRRPMKLTINYRSHSGILNCAAAILDKMFAMFPGAANVLPKDVGLFKGPRPACCQVDGMEGFTKLLAKNERLVMLCVDEDVERVESELTRMNIKNTVLGIRAAKGLEFTDVVLVNFCAHVLSADQTVWKRLINDHVGIASNDHPHIELQLKLLYTAVTRSCNRLLLVETEKTQLSSVMFRWLLGAGLAESFDMSKESAELMTSDEWRAQGIEFALSAEDDIAVMFMQKAVKCFVLAGDDRLLRHATAQLDLRILHNRLTCGTSEHVLSLREEQDAAQTLLQGCRCGLMREVQEVCCLLKDRVGTGVIFKFEMNSRWIEISEEIQK